MVGDRADLDPQPGGVFSLDIGENLARGAYVTVDPPYRVEFSWGIPGSEDLPPGGSTVEVVLTRDGEDTLVVLTHRGLPSTHIGDHREGWEYLLGRLPAAVGRALVG